MFLVRLQKERTKKVYSMLPAFLRANIAEGCAFAGSYGLRLVVKVFCPFSASAGGLRLPQIDELFCALCGCFKGLGHLATSDALSLPGYRCPVHADLESFVAGHVLSIMRCKHCSSARSATLWGC